MNSDDPCRAHLDLLVDAIWGRNRPEGPPPGANPRKREKQNEALAQAIRVYLQAYLDEADGRGPAAP